MLQAANEEEELKARTKTLDILWSMTRQWTPENSRAGPPNYRWCSEPYCAPNTTSYEVLVTRTSI